MHFCVWVGQRDPGEREQDRTRCSRDMTGEEEEEEGGRGSIMRICVEMPAVHTAIQLLTLSCVCL